MRNGSPSPLSGCVPTLIICCAISVLVPDLIFIGNRDLGFYVTFVEIVKDPVFAFIVKDPEVAVKSEALEFP